MLLECEYVVSSHFNCHPTFIRFFLVKTKLCEGDIKTISSVNIQQINKCRQWKTPYTYSSKSSGWTVHPFNRLGGLVVRVSALNTGDPRWFSAYACLSHTGDLQLVVVLVATLPDAWSRRVSARAEWLGVYCDWVRYKFLIFCLSVSARKIFKQTHPWDTLCMLLGR